MMVADSICCNDTPQESREAVAQPIEPLGQTVVVVDQVQRAVMLLSESNGVLVRDDAVVPPMNDFDLLPRAVEGMWRIIRHVKRWCHQKQAVDGNAGCCGGGDPSPHAGPNQYDGAAFMAGRDKFFHPRLRGGQFKVVEAFDIKSLPLGNRGQVLDFSAPWAALLAVDKMNKWLHDI